jgi:hypothetical protein
MKPLLAQIRIKKLSAEMTNVPPVNTKIQGTAGQTGIAQFGKGPDGKELVHFAMTLDASVIVESTKEPLLQVHSELEAVFVELEPAITENSTPAELTKAGDFYAAQLYPHAMSHINRIFNEMGFGSVQVNLQYPGSL